MLPLPANLPVITNELYELSLFPILVFPEGPALNQTLSPACARVTVVDPTVNVFHVSVSVEYKRLTVGGFPLLAIDTVELSSSAVRQSPQ